MGRGTIAQKNLAWVTPGRRPDTLVHSGHAGHKARQTMEMGGMAIRGGGGHRSYHNTKQVRNPSGTPQGHEPSEDDVMTAVAFRHAKAVWTAGHCGRMCNAAAGDGAEVWVHRPSLSTPQYPTTATAHQVHWNYSPHTQSPMIPQTSPCPPPPISSYAQRSGRWCTGDGLQQGPPHGGPHATACCPSIPGPSFPTHSSDV